MIEISEGSCAGKTQRNPNGMLQIEDDLGCIKCCEEEEGDGCENSITDNEGDSLTDNDGNCIIYN